MINDDDLPQYYHDFALAKAIESHINKCGNFKSNADRLRFERLFFQYPIWPGAPRGGSYRYHLPIDDSTPFDRDAYDFCDPLYYTPRRAKQLALFNRDQRINETYYLNCMFSKVSCRSSKEMAFRTMKLATTNTTYAIDLMANVQVAVLESPEFMLSSDEKSTLFKAQMLEYFLWALCPQKMVVLEAFLCLKELAVYHYLDVDTLIDMYEYSLFHPNAIVCSKCRSINWIFGNPSMNNDEFLMCVNVNCEDKLRRKDRRTNGFLALPFENFNMDHYKLMCL
jgi:hypothetical protein